MLYSYARFISATLVCFLSMVTYAAEIPTVNEPQDEPRTGQLWQVDDALFHGCYHNAFEGEPIEQENGRWKSGPQAIQRTKGILTGQGTAHHTMELRFRLDQAPGGASDLRIVGLNDRHEQVHPIRVTVNGEVLASELTFPQNQAPGLGLNQRYYVGWETRTVQVPAGLLRKGENRLQITNTTDAFAVNTWPFVLIDYVEWSFSEATAGVIQPPSSPLFYYGLQTGVETHLWPVAAMGNRVNLLVGSPLEYNFFATFPQDLPLGTEGPLAGEPTRPEREILLHVWTPSPIAMLTLAGEAVEYEVVEGGRLFVQPIDRLIKFETPHPSQGVRLYLQAEQPFEDGHLRAWYTVDGVPYKVSEYPLASLQLEPVENRDTLDFQISLWGGGIPDDAEAMNTYIRTLKGAGFNHAFTGQNDELNRQLSAAGFSVHPRYGWFGHGFSVTEALAEYAAVSPAGEPLTRDFCPLAILANPEHPVLGKYFAKARTFAALPHIDGLCVDYECAPVWCWCDDCLSLFRKETGHDIADREAVAPAGPLADAYRDFGRRRNRDLLAHVKQVMQAVNPDLEYLALASAADVPAYWYDPRRARHSIRELTTFADAIYASHYCYEVPGGMKAVLPTIDTVRKFAVQSGRPVEARLIAPVAQTVSEFPRYRQASMRPEMTRLMVLLTALGGGKGISFFRGDCFDGSQYAAVRQAVQELVQLQPYLAARLDRSNEVSALPTDEVELRFETELAQNLLSRFIWRPQIQYYYDHVQLLRDDSGRDRLVVLFNYADSPLDLRLRFTGLYDDNFSWEDALTGEAIAKTDRRQLEGEGAVFEVPPRACRLLRLVVSP